MSENAKLVEEAAAVSARNRKLRGERQAALRGRAEALWLWDAHGMAVDERDAMRPDLRFGDPAKQPELREYWFAAAASEGLGLNGAMQKLRFIRASIAARAADAAVIAA